MKTTRAMLVIGVLMLVLAVIVAQGLRPEETTTVSGPVVSGSVSKSPESPAARPVPGTPPASPSSNGVLVPLDAGTLKMDSTTPASRLAPASSPINQPDTAVKDTQKREGSSGGTPVSPVPASAAAEPQKAPAPKDTPAAPEKLVVTTSAPQTLTAGQKAISRTRLEVGPRTVTFRLAGVSTLKGKAFTLKDPDRIVVDLDGSWGINLGRTPVNALLKSVRAGAQEANTRLVFDLHKAPKSFKLIQVDPKTLELQIR